jgi:hypothetical protein
VERSRLVWRSTSFPETPFVYSIALAERYFLQLGGITDTRFANQRSAVRSEALAPVARGCRCVRVGAGRPIRTGVPQPADLRICGPGEARNSVH